MNGEKRTRDRLLKQWADVALRAKKRYVRSLLRQGYRWAVCQEASGIRTSRYSDPSGYEDRQVLAVYRSQSQAFGCLYNDLYALGSNPHTDCSGRYCYEWVSDGIEHSERGTIYLVDLSDEDDVRYFFRCLE